VSRNKKQKKILIITILSIILIVLFIPGLLSANLESDVSFPDLFRYRFSLYLLVMLNYSVSAIFLLFGLKSFAKTFKRAYLWLSYGVVLLGVSFIQWPLLVATMGTDVFWINSGALIMPFLISSVLIYSGFRKFGLLLNLKKYSMSRFFVFTTSLMFVFLNTIVYTLYAPDNSAGFEGESYIATTAWTTAFGTYAWITSKYIHKSIGKRYRVAIGHLCTAILFVTIAGWHETIISYFYGEYDFYVGSGLSFIPFTISSLFFLRSGYSFYAGSIQNTPITESFNSIDSTPRQAYIGSITHIASWASQPVDIDPILDDLRSITSRMNPDEKSAPTKEEKEAFKQIYIRLENYMAFNEPVRPISKSELRSAIAPALRELVVSGDTKTSV
jgi:hypothetical protein